MSYFGMGALRFFNEPSSFMFKSFEVRVMLVMLSSLFDSPNFALITAFGVRMKGFSMFLSFRLMFSVERFVFVMLSV